MHDVPYFLVNPRCGIVLRTVQKEHHPSIPSSLQTVQAHIAKMAWHYPSWQNDIISGGSTFGDYKGAYRAALGEAAERYCANYLCHSQVVRASYNDLCAEGQYALDPERMILFSEQLYAMPGCPLAPFTRSTTTYWVPGHSLTRECQIWLPLSFVYINWYTEPYIDAPVTHTPLYAGIAAGATFEQAILSGIEEWIERDITMVWWLNRHPLPTVQLPLTLAQLWEGSPTTLGQRAWLIPLPNEFGIPVMAGVVENTIEQLLTIGFACRHDPIQAALKAWTEALILQEGSRDLLDPQGAIAQAVTDGWFADMFKPWRAARNYLDDFRDDFRDVTHLLMQQQLFLDPRAIEQVRDWVETPTTLSFDELSQCPDRTLATYRQIIEARGYEIVWADVTTPDVAAAGLRVVRVLIPGLVPNFPAAFPPLGLGRVQSLPVQLGWREDALDEHELNYFPLPHA
ncbi:MAG: YcaO-like family protein [Chloroflexota bacterium]